MLGAVVRLDRDAADGGEGTLGGRGLGEVGPFHLVVILARGEWDDQKSFDFALTK